MADHQSLGVEARALLDVIAGKLEAAAASPAPTAAGPSASDPGGEHPTGFRCTGCPICASVTYLKDHQELGAQLAQGALLIVGAVRQYLEQSPKTPPPGTPGPSSPSTAWVQRIDIT